LRRGNRRDWFPGLGERGDSLSILAVINHEIRKDTFKVFNECVPNP
jgi:hypothetical protein